MVGVVKKRWHGTINHDPSKNFLWMGEILTMMYGYSDDSDLKVFLRDSWLIEMDRNWERWREATNERPRFGSKKDRNPTMMTNTHATTVSVVRIFVVYVIIPSLYSCFWRLIPLPSLPGVGDEGTQSKSAWWQLFSGLRHFSNLPSSCSSTQFLLSPSTSSPNLCLPWFIVNHACEPAICVRHQPLCPLAAFNPSHVDVSTIEISHGTLHINGNVVSRTLGDQKVSQSHLYSAPRGVFRDCRTIECWFKTQRMAHPQQRSLPQTIVSIQVSLPSVFLSHQWDD